MDTRWEESEKRREKSRRERVRRKKMQMREKVGKSRNTVFFQWFVAPEGRKVGSLKRRVRSQLARWEMKNCMPLWREAHFQVKMYKTHHVRTTFGSWDVEKVHAVVARSTFRSQNAQSTPCSEHFWKLRFLALPVQLWAGVGPGCSSAWSKAGLLIFLAEMIRCWKSARGCGAKHISKSKCAKHTMFGTLLEIEMSKKCTPLWREAHFQVKSGKNSGGSDHFWTFGCRFAWQTQGILHLAKSEQNVRFCSIFNYNHYTTLHSIPLHYSYNYNYTTIHYLHYTTLRFTTLHSTSLHCTTLNYTTLRYTTLHYITALNYTALH